MFPWSNFQSQSPPVIPQLLSVPQQPAEIISGIMDWPVVYLVARLWGSVHVFGARMRRCLYARPDAELSPVSRVQTGSCQGHGAVKWKACQSLLAWCRVTVRGCVMFLGYWLNDLGLDDRSLNPCRLSARWQRNVSSTCLHIDLRNLPDWHVRIPKVSPSGPRYNLLMTLSVFHAWLALALVAVETFSWTRVVFFPWYHYGLPVWTTKAIQLTLPEWQGWEINRTCRILDTVMVVGWEVKRERVTQLCLSCRKELCELQIQLLSVL